MFIFVKMLLVILGIIILVICIVLLIYIAVKMFKEGSKIETIKKYVGGVLPEGLTFLDSEFIYKHLFKKIDVYGLNNIESVKNIEIEGFTSPYIYEVNQTSPNLPYCSSYLGTYPLMSYTHNYFKNSELFDTDKEKFDATLRNRDITEFEGGNNIFYPEFTLFYTKKDDDIKLYIPEKTDFIEETQQKYNFDSNFKAPIPLANIFNYLGFGVEVKKAATSIEEFLSESIIFNDDKYLGYYYFYKDMYNKKGTLDIKGTNEYNKKIYNKLKNDIKELLANPIMPREIPNNIMDYINNNKKGLFTQKIKTLHNTGIYTLTTANNNKSFMTLLSKCENEEDLKNLYKVLIDTCKKNNEEHFNLLLREIKYFGAMPQIDNQKDNNGIEKEDNYFHIKGSYKSFVKIDNKLLKPGEKVAIKLQKSMIIS